MSSVQITAILDSGAVIEKLIEHQYRCLLYLKTVSLLLTVYYKTVQTHLNLIEKSLKIVHNYS